jgi:tRNA(fMet)-specific endonuclease VapC
MIIRYLVDTDWVIDYLLGVEPIVQKLDELKPKGLAISVITMAEVLEGVYYSRKPSESQRGFDDFLEDIPVLEVNEKIAKNFGMERGRLRKNGKIIGDFDILIAATCIANDLTLLTNNLRHFERIEGLPIISLPK